MVPGSSSSSGKKENYWRIDPSLGGEGGGGYGIEGSACCHENAQQHHRRCYTGKEVGSLVLCTRIVKHAVLWR